MLAGYVVVVSIEQYPFTVICCSLARWQDMKCYNSKGKEEEEKALMDGTFIDMKYLQSSCMARVTFLIPVVQTAHFASRACCLSCSQDNPSY